MNRQQRRGHVKRAGGDWRREQEARRRSIESDRMALQMTPEAARQALAQWASIPGRTQEEVDALNVGAHK